MTNIWPTKRKKLPKRVSQIELENEPNVDSTVNNDEDNRKTHANLNLGTIF